MQGHTALYAKQKALCNTGLTVSEKPSSFIESTKQFITLVRVEYARHFICLAVMRNNKTSIATKRHAVSQIYEYYSKNIKCIINI